MLLQFSCSNHKSIREEILFSLIATNDETFEEDIMVFNKHRILRESVIYGANGSGKSNVIDALSFVQLLVLHSIKHQPGDVIFQNPHKLSLPDDESSYSLLFEKGEVKFAFGFTLKKGLVTEEYLYYYPKNRRCKVYERIGDKIHEGSTFRGAFDTSAGVLKRNRLFLSCAANFSNVQATDEAFRFFREDLVIYNRGLGQANWLQYSIRKMHSDDSIKNRFVQAMMSLGTGLKNVDIEIKKAALEKSEIPDIIPEHIRNSLINGMAGTVKTEAVYDKFTVDLKDESVGIRNLFSLVCPMIDILDSDKVLVVDELEAGLHESITHKIVERFKKAQHGSKAQLIFSTHNTSLLDLSIFRRDQIWFTELRDGDRSTDLYSLSDIRNVRRNENISRGYIAGKYGAIPMMNANLF